jgi:hypothetical protein
MPYWSTKVSLCNVASFEGRVQLRSTVTRKDSLNAMTASTSIPSAGLCVANGLDELDCLCVPLRSEEVISATRIEDLAANSYSRFRYTERIDGRH